MILSKHHDSLIKRKRGLEKAEEISHRAQRILDVGGAATCEGKRMLTELDDELQKEGGSMNPGTTADLTATALFILLLTGWRP
jgi:triphosphoribosyl-dephospho-CoA synthase